VSERRAGSLTRRFWVAGLLGCSVVAGWIYLGPVPDLGQVDTPTIVDRNGVVLYEPLSLRGDRSEAMKADALPPLVVQATIAAEDKRFFTHHGIDSRAVLRAAWHDVKRFRLAEGGSTISQQVAKLLLGRKDRGLIDKAHEAIVAVRLERRYSKNEILALYLNLAPYGNQTMGVARASRLYFGRGPEDLTAAQAAFLAALPQRPGAFNPLRDEKRAIARQRQVLTKMHALGYMTERELASARDERLRFERGEHRVGAQHFIERVLERAPKRRRIETTLDASLQREIAGIIAAQKQELLAHGAHSVAVAVLDNRTGEWLAWEGSGDYFGLDFGGAIDGVTALRQPGSALKPFTYALAFERGDSPSTVLADVPSHFATAEKGIVYTPRNYDGRYRGPLRVRAALAGSENVPAVAMAAKLGPASLLRFLRRAGFSDFEKTSDYYGVGLTLGDAEVRLEQLVAAYSVFARGGVYVEPAMIRRAGSPTRRVISERTAFWITDILSDPDAREYVFGRGGSLDFPFAVAVKTGTSQAYRDNWTVGYTKDVTVGVWVGNFDRQELRNSTGVTGAGPIFHAVMLSAAKRARGGRLPVGDDAPIVEPPAGIERAPICALSGLRPSTHCPNITSEWVASDAPVQFCSWHHDGYVDWPAEYRAWSAAAMPPPSTKVALAKTSLQILSPPNGATYLIDPTLRMAYQTLKLRASSRKVTWHVDQQQVATAEWELQPGWHTVTAVDDAGRRESVQIVVK